MGSFGITLDHRRLESTLWGIVYPSSKAALNMATTMYANGFSGTQTVEQGAEPVVEACVADELPAGFVGRSGALPW